MKNFYAILRPSLFEGSAWLKNIAIGENDQDLISYFV